MRKGITAKIIATVLLVLLIAMQIFGVAGLLQPNSSADIAESFESLIYPFKFHLIFVFALDLLFILYLLYSAGFIARKQYELLETYVAIADVGLILVEIISIVDVYVWHYELFWVNVILRILMIIILIRIVMAYPERSKKYLFDKLPFDLSLGSTIFSAYLALAMTFVARGTEGALFSVNARAVLILLALTLTAMIIGLVFKNIFSLFTILGYEGFIAAIHLSRNGGFDGRFPEIYIAAILSMAGLIAAIIVAFIQRKRA